MSLTDEFEQRNYELRNQVKRELLGKDAGDLSEEYFSQRESEIYDLDKIPEENPFQFY